jgi:nucleotide-binding universal stress UspA family protein
MSRASAWIILRHQLFEVITMSNYKTIVVHLADERRAGNAIAVAARLAHQHDAHLVGLFVDLPDVISAPFGLGRSVIAAGRAAIRSRAEAIHAQFEAACKGLQLKAEWRFAEPHRDTASHTLMTHVRSADLVVVSQSDATWDDSLLMEFPEELLLQSGRPVLFVPNAGSYETVGSRVLVAWNERREAARAVFDALPMLRKADAVRVMWINPEADAAGKGDVPTVEIAKALARHGINVSAAESRGSDLDVGTELLNQAADWGANLLVMGGYGHHRFRQFVFGGATRQIFEHMTVPILMSH